MSLEESMADTAKELKLANNEGGFFYFVGDAKGDNAALMVFNKKKDSDGAKTFRLGRGLLKDFKAEHKPAFYSQGELLKEGSSLIFSITKGNAKPAAMKRAFKSSDLLHKGVGASVLGLLKGARIVMAAGADEEADSAPATTTAAEASIDEQALSAWATENAELLGDMSPEEIREIFAAEQAFAARAAMLPRSAEEDTELQIRQAETEAALESLAQGSQQLETLKRTDPAAALTLENTLNQQRVALAQKNAIGPDPFAKGVLSGPDQEAFTAAIRAGLELLLARVISAQQEITLEQQRLDALAPEAHEAARKQLSGRVQALSTELNAIQTQLRAASSR